MIRPKLLRRKLGDGIGGKLLLHARRDCGRDESLTAPHLRE